MLYIIASLLLIACGAFVCGYGIAVSRVGEKRTGDAGSSGQPEEYKRQSDSAARSGEEAYQSIQNTIDDIRRSGGIDNRPNDNV